MKTPQTILLRIYQLAISPIIKQLLGVSSMCRYSPSCSEYTKQMIAKEGFFTGSHLGFKRLLTCHPFYTKISYE